MQRQQQPYIQSISNIQRTLQSKCTDKQIQLADIFKNVLLFETQEFQLKQMLYELGEKHNFYLMVRAVFQEIALGNLGLTESQLQLFLEHDGSCKFEKLIYTKLVELYAGAAFSKLNNDKSSVKFTDFLLMVQPRHLFKQISFHQSDQAFICNELKFKARDIIKQILRVQLIKIQSMSELCKDISPIELFRQITNGRQEQSFTAPDLFSFLLQLPAIFRMEDAEIICSGLQLSKTDTAVEYENFRCIIGPTSLNTNDNASYEPPQYYNNVKWNGLDYMDKNKSQIDQFQHLEITNNRNNDQLGKNLEKDGQEDQYLYYKNEKSKSLSQIPVQNQAIYIDTDKSIVSPKIECKSIKRQSVRKKKTFVKLRHTYDQQQMIKLSASEPVLKKNTTQQSNNQKPIQIKHFRMDSFDDKKATSVNKMPQPHRLDASAHQINYPNKIDKITLQERHKNTELINQAQTYQTQQKYFSVGAEDQKYTPKKTDLNNQSPVLNNLYIDSSDIEYHTIQANLNRYNAFKRQNQTTTQALLSARNQTNPQCNHQLKQTKSKSRSAENKSRHNSTQQVKRLCIRQKFERKPVRQNENIFYGMARHNFKAKSLEKLNTQQKETCSNQSRYSTKQKDRLKHTLTEISNIDIGSVNKKKMISSYRQLPESTQTLKQVLNSIQNEVRSLKYILRRSGIINLKQV